jgi:hypothetical protein
MAPDLTRCLAQKAGIVTAKSLTDQNLEFAKSEQ